MPEGNTLGVPHQRALVRNDIVLFGHFAILRQLLAAAGRGERDGPSRNTVQSPANPYCLDRRSLFEESKDSPKPSKKQAVSPVPLPSRLRFS